MSKKRSRAWCFTVNNYSYDDVIQSSLIPSSTYIILGFEVGASGTPHIQGYVHYSQPQTFSRVKKDLPRKTHIELSKGKPVQAYSYCMKDMDFIEIGDRPIQGKRTDLECIRIDLERGRPISEIKKQYFSQWVFHRRAFAEYLEDERYHDECSFILYDGKSGVHVTSLSKKYDSTTDIIFKTECDLTSVVLAYTSRKYRYIFVNSFWCPDIESLSKIEFSFLPII